MSARIESKAWTLQLTAFPLLGRRFGRWFGGSFRCRLIVVAASLHVVVIYRAVSLTGRNISKHCTVGALRLLQLWLSHDVVWRLLIYVVVVTRSIVVDKIDESCFSWMNVVVNSVGVVQWLSIDVIRSLRNSLENRFNLKKVSDVSLKISSFNL